MSTTPTSPSQDTPTVFNEKTYLVWMHLSQLLAFVGIPPFIGPIVMWLLKREQYPEINTTGKDILNFQITMLIAGIISAILTVVLVGMLGLAILTIALIVLPIMAAMAVNKGQSYRYPFTIRFIK